MKVKKKKPKSFVGPEGQNFADFDLHAEKSTPREANPATNQPAADKPREKTIPERYENLPQDREDRNSEPDYRHN